jgi:small subunit ribosomal protein S25e
MAKGKGDDKSKDPKKDAKKKVSLLSKPSNSGGDGKGKKKKWSKSKVKDKLDSAVYFDQETYDKLVNDIPVKNRVITTAVISDKLKINASLARHALTELEARGVIARVGDPHSSLKIYTRAV